MIIVLIIITILACFVNKCLDEYYSDDLFLVILGIIAVEIIATFVMVGIIVNGRVIDQKIDLMQSQNEDIENKIELSVKQYMNYEQDTYKDLKADSYIQLVNLYPNLKSDTLIQQQMNLYQSNNDNITKLKMDKIGISNYKWWVYFGK